MTHAGIQMHIKNATWIWINFLDDEQHLLAEKQALLAALCEKS